MLLDTYLPEYHYNEQHSIKIRTPSSDLYRSMLQTDISRSFIIKTLFWLRGMPKAGTIRDMDKMGFVKLDEKEGEEIVFGIISNNSFFTGCRLHFTPQEFINEKQPGHIKAAINFRIDRQTGSSNTAMVSTETRVLCGSAATKNKFRLYWFMVQPFSRLIRRLMLLEIKRKIEENKCQSISYSNPIQVKE